MKTDPAARGAVPEPGHNALAHLRAEAAGCRRCDLWQNATQTVFGEGPSQAEILFVGEQPGDQEDLTGKPFVGPAGRLLDRALEETGIDRARAYVTNAVKHFKNEPRGKRRLHKSPNAAEIEICRWWLEREIALVAPRIVVALGASALLSLTGLRGGVLKLRGTLAPSPFARDVFVMVHPSSILRTRDAAREQAWADFLRDLRKLKARIAA